MDVFFSSFAISTDDNTIMVTKGGDTIAQTSLKRQCKGCPTIVISPAVNCASCRVKNNKKKRVYKAAKKEQILKNVLESVMNTGDGGGKDLEDKKQKRKREDDGDGNDATLKKKKKVHGISLVPNSRLKTKALTPPCPVAPPGEMNEFQNELEMVRQLKEIGTRPSSFHACYSIVADPSVSHRTQARVVARNIKKSAKLPFNYKDPIPPTTERISSSYMLRFRCECHLRSPLTKPKPLASCLTSELTTRVPLKMTDSQVKLAKSGMNSSDAIVEESRAIPCKGVIEVTTEVDTSHPLGIPGQRIKVEIHHPQGQVGG